MRTLSPAAEASLLAEETDEVWLILLTVSHPDLDDPITIVNDINEIVSNGVTFRALPFEIELPGEGQRPGESRIRIDNVSREIVEAVRIIGLIPPTVKIQVVLASQPDVIEYEVPVMTLRDVTYDAAFVTGVLRFEDISVEPVAEIINPNRFPALF